MPADGLQKTQVSATTNGRKPIAFFGKSKNNSDTDDINTNVQYSMWVLDKNPVQYVSAS